MFSVLKTFLKKLFKLIDILILSRREYTTLLNIAHESFSASLYLEKSKVLTDLGIYILVITLGEKGALLIFQNNSYYIPTIKLKNVEDTTGAGDAFSTGFIYEYLRIKKKNPENLKRCVEVGNFVASKCIQTLGARKGIPSGKDVEFFKKNLNNKI
jgi:ribokinase